MSDLLRAVDALLEQVRRERAATESHLEELKREEQMLNSRRRTIAASEQRETIIEVPRSISPNAQMYITMGARGAIKKAITDVIDGEPGLTPGEIADRLERLGVPKRGSSYRQTVYNALGPMRENEEVVVRDGRYYPAQ